MNTVVVFVKYPEPGKVKTRLAAEIGNELACEFYKVFMAETFALLAESRADKIMVAFAPPARETDFQKLIPSGFERFPQRGDGLGERITYAFEDAFARGARKVLAFGSDSPTVPPGFLHDAFNALEEDDAVVGPTFDGGYYLIGLKSRQAGLFRNINWSSATVLQETLHAAARLKLRIVQTDAWYDIDDLGSLRRAVESDNAGAIARLFKSSSLT